MPPSPSSPTSLQDPHHAPEVRVRILGPLKIVDQHGTSPAPRAAHHLIAILAAVGKTGISREALAHELWGSSLPDSWMSALRNRTTAARKALGASSVSSSNGRYYLGPHVHVDSWDLITHARTANSSTHELSFLDGEPLVDVPSSDITASHAAQVREARITLIDQALTTHDRLSAQALQSLRVYQRHDPLDPAVAEAAVLAHLRANQQKHAVSILAGIHRAASDLPEPPSWVAQLKQLLPAAPANTRERPISMRARLFDEAVMERNWSLALEIATEGGPAAERSEGDPERLALLERIPEDELETPHRFKLTLALARHMIYAGREADARLWAERTRAAVSSPSDQLLSDIMTSVVGNAGDERAAVPIPAGFNEMAFTATTMRSLQVLVMSHHTRGNFAEAQTVRQRFEELVEQRGEPHPRWHLMLLQSMSKFVNGELKDAAEAANAAFQHAVLFGIADAEIGLIGQLSNARLIDPSLPGIDDYELEHPAGATSALGRALSAVSRVNQADDDAVDQFLGTYNYRSHMFFTFATINAVAPYVRNDELRAELESRLRQRTGTSAIWGTGVLHLGPVDRTLARIVVNRSEVPGLLADAVAVADRHQTRLWQVVCRLDLAAVTKQRSIQHQAEELATTPELQDLVNSYEPWPLDLPG